MSGPTPDDVATGDLYGRFQPDSLRETVAPHVDRVTNAIRDPDDAEGWPAILIPAIVSALLINYLRRFV